MWIQVRTMDGKETHRMDSLSKLTKVEDLRKRVYKVFRVAPDRQRLFYRGKQMEDGHSLFDYNVGLNDIVQLLVRQSPGVLPLANKEKDSELSDTDSGCGSGQSESDKSSNNGEGALEMEGQPSTSAQADLVNLVDPGFGYYKINELVDARDTSMGAWFEAQVVNVTLQEKAANKANESDEESELPEAVAEEDVIYHVKYEDYPENGVIQLSSKDVRARARTILKWEELETGDFVMLNYNPDDPKERGFWYDAKILQKRETRTYKELYAKIVLGNAGNTLNDCRITLVDEIYKIEKPGCAVPLTADSPMKRQSGPVCKHCKDNPNKPCRMCACHVCGGKESPEKQLMCDECDMAFHIYCLNPPLSRIPDEDDWYCPECRIDASEVVLAGEKLKESKKKAKMASANSSSQRDWGKGMACVGRSRECTIVPSNHYGPIPGVPVGTMWKFRVQTLLVEYSRGYPLCMDQYSRLFASCRLPGPKHDSVLLPPPGRRPATYITVVRNFQFFQLEVYNSDGTPLTVDQLHSQLHRIRGQSWKTDKEPLGVLTSDHRHTWGQAYTTLMRDKLNRESARAIQRSLFTVCLDAPVLKVSDARAGSRLAAQMLHGGGSYSNSGNRWFDKTLQFIVGEDGSCGVLYEQAVAEGPPIATIIDHVLDYCKDPDLVRAPLIPLPMPEKLYFRFTPEIKRDIEHAKQNLDILITDLDISCFTYHGFGKEFLKRLGLSPDSVLQVALQLAYYRAHGELCATAESASLRRFHRGRTETIRSTTSAALAFVQAMADENQQASEKLSLLKEAVKVHSTLTEEALDGQGIDRHLLGLKLEAIADGFRVPELFMDTSYAVASYWKLSTGQVAARTDCVMCYGPLVPDGYAVCYNPLPAHVNFSVTAFNCCQETNAEHLAGSIQRALDDMGALLGNCKDGGS